MERAMNDSPKGLSTASRKLWATFTGTFEWDEGQLAILEKGLQANDLDLRAGKQIKRDGLMVRDHLGDCRPHPLLLTQKNARAQFLLCMKMLGLHISAER
jgi:hypothetical protein